MHGSQEGKAGSSQEADGSHTQVIREAKYLKQALVIIGGQEEEEKSRYGPKQ